MTDTEARTCGQCTWLTIPVNGKSCTDQGITSESKPCKHFRSESDDLVQLKFAADGHDSLSTNTWLPANYSRAFVICIGAGPWKFNRRLTVQQNAVAWLNNRELETIAEPVSCYPLDWQNTTVSTLASNLRAMKTSMHDFCSKIIKESAIDSAKSRRDFYSACGNPKGFKVLSLFCRDALKIDSFPIDRHVQRRIDKFNLPNDENALVHLCNKSNLPSRNVATWFVHEGENGRGLNKGNPDWTDE